MGWGALAAMAGSLGMGLLKNQEDKKRYEKDKHKANITTMYSPWTGLVGQNPSEPSTMGTMMPAALTGLSMAQQMQSQNQQQTPASLWSTIQDPQATAQQPQATGNGNGYSLWDQQPQLSKFSMLEDEKSKKAPSLWAMLAQG